MNVNYLGVKEYADFFTMSALHISNKMRPEAKMPRMALRTIYGSVRSNASV